MMHIGTLWKNDHGWYDVFSNDGNLFVEYNAEYKPLQKDEVSFYFNIVYMSGEVYKFRFDSEIF